MKVLVFSTHILWPSHYETELEIIENHLRLDDEVIHFVCNGDFKSCDLNINHSLETCLKCTSVVGCGRTLLSKKIDVKPIISISERQKGEIKSFISRQTYSNLKEVQSINYKNFDVGYAVSASLIAHFRNSKPNVNFLREQICNLLKSNLELYISTINYIDKFKPERVYAFNGKFSHVKAVLRACQSREIDCYIHERGSEMSKYDLWKNTTPHDLEYTSALIEEYWNCTSPEIREKLGREFYTEKIIGKDQGWYSFTKNHEDKLPESWDHRKKNIIIFNSSEDEFASIGPEWENPIYPDQITGIRSILTDLQNEKDVHIYLRMHPNLQGVYDEDTTALYNLSYPNLTIIPPESKIGSYQLLFQSHCVITFGSTMGIEAVFWNKPSITLGKNYYWNMNAAYQPSSHEEAVSILKSELRTFGYEQALKFGFFFKTFGINYKHYVPTDIKEGEFKSTKLQKSESLLYRLFLRGKRTRIIQRGINIIEKFFSKRRLSLPYIMLK